MKAEKRGLSPRPTPSPTQGEALQEKGRRHWISHKPATRTVMTQKMQRGWGDGKLEFEGKMTIHFFLPGAKQSQWFPIKEPRLSGFLTQFTPLPVQRGANCTCWSCLPRGFILIEGKHCLHNYPLSNSSPGRQLSSRDSPQAQLHSGTRWTTLVPEGLPELRYLQRWGHVKSILAATGGMAAFSTWEMGQGREALSTWKKLE